MPILHLFGLYPAHPFSLAYPLVALALWLLFLPVAYFKRIRIFYNSSLRAALLEEFVYRGLLYGGILYAWHSQLLAIVASSLVFGLAHMRNVWWAGWRRSWRTSTYAGFRAGPVFAVIRWLSGDIYLSILVHFLHNLVVMLPPPGMGDQMAPTPTDGELRERSER